MEGRKVKEGQGISRKVKEVKVREGRKEGRRWKEGRSRKVEEVKVKERKESRRLKEVRSRKVKEFQGSKGQGRKEGRKAED